MKITRKQLRVIINEQLNIHDKSKFAKKYNQGNDYLSRAGILSWVDKYAKGDFDRIRFNNIHSWLQEELYESLRNSNLMSTTSPASMIIDEASESKYFSYYDGKAFLNDMSPLVKSMPSIEFRYDGFDREFIQWTAKESNAHKRKATSSKVYYTVVLKDPNIFDIDAFVEQFKIVMKNIALQLVTICGKSHIDRLSFKTWSKLDLLLRTQDSIVIYTDDENESIFVKKWIDQLLSQLNKDPRLSLIKVLNSNERQTQLNRVVIGTDYAPINFKSQSDTSMLSYVMASAMLNNQPVFNRMKQLLDKLHKDRDIDGFIANFNLSLGDAMKSVTKQWINFSSRDKVDAFERARQFLSQK